MRRPLARRAASQRGRAVALCVLALLLAGCARSATSVDWRTLEAEGRVVDAPEGMDLMLQGGSYLWTDGVVGLELTPVAGFMARGVRLTTTLSGAQGNATRFMLDTGSVGSLLSTDAPLAKEVMLSRVAFRTQGTHAQGHMGHLPVVRMGGIEGRNLTVAVVTASEIPDVERNILGILHLHRTQLEHRGARWTLRSGASRLPTSEPGWAVVRLEPGTPVVRVMDPAGRPVHALIDSGAYSSFAVGQGRTGTYRIVATDGAPVHDIPVGRRESRRIDPQAFGGHEISLVLGMDVLTSREWRLTFDRATWAIAPHRARTNPR